MVNGPPCAACGRPLRWIPESNAWGCDQCRKMYPVVAAPQPQPQPQQPAYQQPAQQQPANQQPAPQQPAYQQPQQQPPYQQQQPPYQQPGASPYAPGAAPQGAYVPPAPGHAVPAVSQAKPKSKKGLIIVLALLVVGGGATAAILLLKGGGGSIGGEDSREALVTKILAALDAGDGAALVALAADESRSDEFTDCGDKKKKKDDETEDKERIAHRQKRAREDADKLTASTKGKAFALDETIEEKQNRGSTIKKGEKIGGEDCTSKIEVAFHDLTLKVHDGTKKKATVSFDTVVLDGHWFLGRAPKVEEAGDCKGSVAHMLDVTKVDLVKAHMDVAKVTDAMVKHCEKDVWADKAINCFAGAKVGNDADNCMAMLTSSQTEAVTKDLAKLMEEGKAATPPPPEDKAGSDTPATGSDTPATGSDTPATGPDTPTTGGSDGLPPACDDYAKVIERTIACKGMPEASRDAMKQALDAMKTNYKNLPKDALKAVGDACTQGADALKKALTGLGC